MIRAARPQLALRLALLIGLGVTSLVACGDDEDSVTESGTSNNATNNATTNNGSNNASAVDNQGIPYATEYQQRFTSLRFDEGTAAFGINGILAQNFDQTLAYPIIVLLDLQSVDATAGTVQVRGGSGLKGDAEGAYVWHPDAQETVYEGSLGERTGAFHFEAERFDFVATFALEDEVNEVVLPIRGLTIDGNLELGEGGAQAEIVHGRLRGYLTREDGDSIFVSLVPGGDSIKLTTLFKSDKLNYDSTTGSTVELGTGDSWLLTASFETIPTTIND